jgi:acetyl esterase/lipase
MRESIPATLARFAVRSCLKPALRSSFPVSVQRHWADIATRTLSVPFGVRFSQSSLDGVPTEIVRFKSNARSEDVVLFLHGGAFMIGSPVSHRSITGRLAKHTGATIFAPDYRLAAEHPFPAALDDAFTSYHALLAQGYAAGAHRHCGRLGGGRSRAVALSTIAQRKLAAAGLCSRDIAMGRFDAHRRCATCR